MEGSQLASLHHSSWGMMGASTGRPGFAPFWNAGFAPPCSPGTPQALCAFPPLPPQLCPTYPLGEKEQ